MTLRRLSTVLMLRATTVAVAVLLLVAGSGLMRVDDDIADELDAAMRLVQSLTPLIPGANATGDEVLGALQAPEPAARHLRHLSMTIRDAEGRLLLRRGPEPRPGGAVAWLAAWHRGWRGDPDILPLVWVLPRPDAPDWTVTLAPSADSERHEALATWLQGLAMAVVGVALLLGVMAVTVHRSLAPLNRLSLTLRQLRPGDTAAARRLPAAHVAEVAGVSTAVRALADALDASEAERRLLTQQLIALEEAERSRLAGELHDEWGQRLTGLRLDARLLARLPSHSTGWQEALERLDNQCASLQHDLRHRLHELAPRNLGDGQLDTLEQALQQLARSWHARGGEVPEITLAFGAPPGQTMPLCVPPAIALCVFRASQEALTNVARHARARGATVRVCVSPSVLDWSVSDDGIGIAEPGTAEQRGSGLAQLRERVWALGGEWHSEPAQPGCTPGGWRLAARFCLPYPPPPAPAKPLEATE